MVAHDLNEVEQRCGVGEYLVSSEIKRNIASRESGQIGLPRFHLMIVPFRVVQLDTEIGQRRCGCLVAWTFGFPHFTLLLGDDDDVERLVRRRGELRENPDAVT